MTTKKPTSDDRLQTLEDKVDRLIHRVAVALDLGMEDPPDRVLVEVPDVQSPAVPLVLEPPGMYRDVEIDSPPAEETVTAVAAAAELPVLPTQTDPEHPEDAPSRPGLVVTDPSPVNIEEKKDKNR